jgi:hypothetical protein
LDSINELELRRFIKEKGSDPELTRKLVKEILNPSTSWDEKRALWHFLFLSGRSATLIQGFIQAFKNKTRVPYDDFIHALSAAKIKPTPLAVEGLLKAMRKHQALDDLIHAKTFDKYDSRFAVLRAELIEKKIAEQKKFKENMLEKFEFLRNQRMSEQAARLLRRMLELFPEDEFLIQTRKEFEEQWARDVLSNHMASLHAERDLTITAPSSQDQEMLKCFLEAAEKICIEKRELASEISIIFWFMDDFEKALEIINWAPVTLANDWLKAEILIASRRFIEAMEQLNQLEVKYINDPESTFAVSYMRALCLKALGQHASALEIMQSIVRIRPGYRSANALILEWREGGAWE